MRTDADENLDIARKSVHTAIMCLAEIVVAKCDGSDDYNAFFTKEMRESMNELMKIRDTLE